MKAFDFRLKKVLEYRQLLEGWAKDAYLDARAGRLEAEVENLGIQRQKADLLNDVPTTVEGLLTQELRFNALDDKELQQRVILDVLTDEEAHALSVWTERRRDVSALERLHDRAYEEWVHEMTKEEQAFLDDWSSSRRAA